MKFVILVAQLFLVTALAHADTPPPGTVKAKTWSGDGNTAITSTSGALDVNVKNASGLTTVNQGTAGVDPWLVHFNNSTIGVTGTFFQATQPISGSTGRTWTLLNTTDSVNVGNFPSTFNIGNFPSTQAVTGTFFQATQPVSGPLTDTQLRATPVPISGTITATNSANGATGSAAPAQATQVAGSDGTNLRAVKVSATGVVSVDGSASTQPVSAASLPLPTGASTSAKQPALGTAGTPSSDVLTVQGATSMTALKVDGSAVTQPVSGTFFQATQPVSGNLGRSWTLLNSTDSVNAVQSGAWNLTNISGTISLPTGAATSSNQTTANTSLNSIDTKTPALGQALSAASVPVVLPAAQITTLTPPTTVTVQQSTGSNLHTQVDSSALPTGAATSALQTTMNTTLGSPMQQTGGTVTANAGSGTFAVSAAALPLPSGASTSSLQTTGNTSLNSIDTKTPALGQALAAASVPVVLTASQLSTLTPLSTIAATQSGTWNVGLSTGANTIGKVDQGAGGASAWKVDGSAVTQPVSSTQLPAALGQTTMSASTPVTIASDQSNVATTMPDSFFTGQTAQTATINNIIPTVASANATDASGYKSASVQLVCPAGTYTTGAVIFEGSNDNVNFQTIPVYSQLVVTGTPIVAAITLVTTTSLVYTFPIQTRYIRVRISTAITGASAQVQAFTRLSQATWTPAVTQVAQTTAANLATTATIASGTVTTVSTVTSVTSDNLAIPGIIADVASAAITTTTTTATLTPTFGVGYKVTIPVTVVSGTTPTMVVDVQESGDTGTNWNTVYTFPTIIATGYYESPPLFFRGNRVRYVQTIAGTTPSFTRAINRLQMSSAAAAPVNNNATMATATVPTTCSTLSAPSNAVGFLLENLSSNTVNMFWSIGATLATSTTGMLLEPGRDTGMVPSGKNVTLCAASGTPTYSIQWVQQ